MEKREKRAKALQVELESLAMRLKAEVAILISIAGLVAELQKDDDDDE